MLEINTSTTRTLKSSEEEVHTKEGEQNREQNVFSNQQEKRSISADVLRRQHKGKSLRGVV